MCLENAAGDPLIAGENLTEPTETFRSKRMRVTFGNGLVTMRVGGEVLRRARHRRRRRLRRCRRAEAHAAAGRPAGLRLTRRKWHLTRAAGP